MFTCEQCGKTFSRKDNLKRHKRDSCSKRCIDNEITREEPPAKKRCVKQPAQRFDAEASTSDGIDCQECKIKIPQHAYLGHLRSLQHKQNCCEDLGNGVAIVHSAFKNRIITYRVSPLKYQIDVKEFLVDVKNKILQLLKSEVDKHITVKVNLELFAEYIHQTKEMLEIKSFNTKNKVVNGTTNWDEMYSDFVETLQNRSMEFQERESGWALIEIRHIEANINKVNPTRASSYIKLPKQIETKKAVINIQNNDEYCFAWAITSALHPSDTHPERTTSYPDFNTVFNFQGITFPTKLSDIPRFESNNDISINVYGIESSFKNGRSLCEVVGPLYFSKQKKLRHVNLLMISDDSGNNHYCWIKDMSRLLSSQLSKTDHAKWLCDGCFQYFSSQIKLENHASRDCNHIYTKVPTTAFKRNKLGALIPENLLQFENFERQLKVPFVIYADFESILEPAANPNIGGKTYVTHKHVPYSFAYYVKCSFNNSASKLEVYRGKDVAKTFIYKLEEDVKEIYRRYLKTPVPMKPLSTEEEADFLNAEKCQICEEEFKETDVKVRDHCHLTGLKRPGAAHATCNLNYKIPDFIPIFFHNLTGYDSHLFVKDLCLKKEKIDVIAQTKEKYITFSKHILVDVDTNEKGKQKRKFLKLKFLDSFRFMSSSLEKLAEGLHSSQCCQVRKYFPEEIKFDLIRQKGVFPYTYVDNLERLNEIKLPEKLKFNEYLNADRISDEEYKRAQKVWQVFECKTLGDYSDVYLKSDVLLLADIFENFRNICMQTYKLDPAHYFTSPGLSWDACLRKTGIKLELLTDIEMIHFLKRGIRGGISQCSKRKHIANNKFLESYNPSEPTSFIMYLDATNLYGHSMSQYLPSHKFAWLSESEIEELDIKTISDTSPTGYILEVDVDYPAYLHDEHSDLPFLVENIRPPGAKSNTKKLIPNLWNKRNYVVHYRVLKQAINHGLNLIKIHKVLKFEQSAWLKPYIDLNTELRNKSKTDFERDFYKLMNNSVFGKTMENVDKRVDIRLVSHWENEGKRIGAETLITRPNFKRAVVFQENLVAIQLNRIKVVYNKPIYIGFSILDVSKTVVYDFLYNFVKRKYGNNATLLYTDTDSLVLEVRTDNFYDDMKQNLNRFDTSNYSPDNQFSVPINKSILGKFKDEYKGTPVQSFYGTGAKAYCVEVGGKERKKAKGIKKAVIEEELNLEDYNNVIEEGGKILKKMSIFRSHLHEMRTAIVNKIALSSADDKRFLIPGSVRTLPWGHKDIQLYNDNNDLDALVQLLNEEISNAQIPDAVLEGIYYALTQP